MRYFGVPRMEAAEAKMLGLVYQPHGAVSLNAMSAVDSSPTRLLSVDGETLAIRPDTGSWAFLSTSESELLRAMTGVALLDLERVCPHQPVAAFVTELFRRGLVLINGSSATDANVFDSTNYEEGHLVELLVTE